jgi:hypothetical protein
MMIIPAYLISFLLFALTHRCFIHRQSAITDTCSCLPTETVYPILYALYKACEFYHLDYFFTILLHMTGGGVGASWLHFRRLRCFERNFQVMKAWAHLKEKTHTLSCTHDPRTLIHI